MTDSFRSSLERRRYRLAQAVVVGGSLIAGLLVLRHLVVVFRSDFDSFYGVDSEQLLATPVRTDAELPFVFWQLVIAAMSLASVCAFVWSERRRARQGGQLRRVGRASSREVVIERPRLDVLFDQFILRTSGYAGVLLTLWLLQSCLERSLGGLGWAIHYSDWRSLLPLASVFGLCVLTGMLVAAFSLFGMRAIHVLELALTDRASRVARVYRPWRTRMRRRLDHRTVRQLLGCDVLSRPPPVLA